MRKTVVLVLGVAALIATPAYLARDIWIAHVVEEMLHHQANAKINHKLSVVALSVDSGQGRLALDQVSLTALDDPETLQSLGADRVELDAYVSGLFSPHVRVRHARAYDVDVTLEYIAPGVSNFKLMEQTFQSYVERRQAEGRSRLLEWDLDQLNLYRVHFTLIDIDGQVLAVVQIPEINVSTLSTKNSGKENFSLLMSQIQKSVLQEILMGQVQGEYDTAGLLQLVHRELPNSGLLDSAPVNKFKKAGKRLLEDWLY
ncbi:hypothetical protein KG088_17725 [Halomonas sp. TRM85114]|uniref:hypothetical protein n=1 Tax=Halomonas jincaotanensis TaxID=2810616 RepID=UPI001BD4BBAC|nr:hypothetical protein [Halomonas jincaotanensis]MBS9405447.1 hypothetical protein [Halomonas jincaotanensis]